MTWYDASVIVGAAVVAAAILYPFVTAAVRKAAIDIAMKKATEAKSASEAALEAARDLVQSRLELRRDLQRLAHEVDNLKLSLEFQRDWAAQHARATERRG